MMLVLMLLLVAFLDFSHPAAAPDGLEKNFVVSEITESALTGCATNSQRGTGDDPFTIDWIKPPESATENTAIWTLPPSGRKSEADVFLPTASMAYVPPGGNPDPPPPVPVTPEPSTVAILGITAVVLLFLLFGRRCGRRQALKM